MSKVEELNQFYADILQDVGVVQVDQSGLMSYMSNGKALPVTIDGKRLCLPLPEILKNPDWDNTIPFHPFSEQINLGPSMVLNAYLNYVKERVRVTVNGLAVSLMALAADSKRHKGLKEEEAIFMKGLAEADENAINAVRKFLDAVSEVPERRLITMFLKNGGDDNVLRTCVVEFPILDHVGDSAEASYLDVKGLRKKDKPMITSILNYILGDEETRATFTKGSNNGEAPYFHSLLLSTYALFKHFNNLIARHARTCPEVEELHFDMAWTDRLMDFSSFSKTHHMCVPTLPGNRGKEIPGSQVYEAKSNRLGGGSDEDAKVESKRDEPTSTKPWRSSQSREEPLSLFRRDDRDDRHRDRDRRYGSRDDSSNRSGKRTLSEILGSSRSARDQSRSRY